MRQLVPWSVPWEPWPVPSPGREMLSPAFEESPQGLCVCSAFGCQLWFAFPQPRFSLACLGARLGDGAGEFGSLGCL